MVQAGAVYIHFPFCRKRCQYCSFVSYESLWESSAADYLKSLKNDISARPPGSKLNSLYFGGGTPSLLEVNELRFIINCLGAYTSLQKDAEVSLEANPGTLNLEKLKGYRQLGINRLSIGVQSFDDDLLKKIGRIHTAKQAVEAVELSYAAGFNNISLDLMYGIPNQSLENFASSLQQAILLNPQHISLYGLTISEGSFYHQAMCAGTMLPADEDLMASCYIYAGKLLAEHGYLQYEISNWAREGYQSKHNMVYWQQGIWLGYGCAACSFDGQRRYTIDRNLDSYMQSALAGTPFLQENEEVSQEDLLAEGIILALRLNEGAKFKYFKDRYHIDLARKYVAIIKEMRKAGLLEVNQDGIVLTERGRLLSNEVFWRFLP
ncbi:MAG: radical SAM family heme chaperone HemW [Chloroflexi bacterium]|nr:radical SAM family heme chaperone HemW [Chloroflexota bacterium]